MIDTLFADQICAGGMIPGDDPAGVAQVRRVREIESSALIDFLDRPQRTLAHLTGHHGVRSRLGKYEAERDGRLGHEEAPGAVRQLSRRKKAGLVPLYHQFALRVIRAISIKNVLASH